MRTVVFFFSLQLYYLILCLFASFALIVSALICLAFTPNDKTQIYICFLPCFVLVLVCYKPMLHFGYIKISGMGFLC